jgi:hypothetical protein
MVTGIDLTLDCADAPRLAQFWKAAIGYVDEPPPSWSTCCLITW